MSEPPREREKLPAVVYVLALSTFVMGTSNFAVTGLLPAIAEDLGVSVARAGLLITVFAVGVIVGAPGTALLTLRLPRRTALLAALALFAVAHLIIALSSSFALVLVARVLAALATGAFWAVGAVVATLAAGVRQAAASVGVMVSGATLANVVGVPAGVALGQLLGWRGPFWALAVLAAAAAVVVAKQVPADQTRQGGGIGPELAALRQPRLWLVYLTMACVNGSMLASYGFVTPLLVDRAGLGAGAVPFVLLAFGVGAFIGSRLGGRLGDRRPFVTLLGGCGLTVVALAGLTVIDHPIGVIACLMVLGLAGFGLGPGLVAMALRLAGSAPTLASSLSTSSFNVGIAFGSWLASIALTTGLGLRGPSFVGLCMALAGFVPVLLLRRSEPARD